MAIYNQQDAGSASEANGSTPGNAANRLVARLPVFLVTSVYAALAAFAPPQILHVLDLAWLDEGLATWLWFILPLFLYSIANVILTLGMTAHRPRLDASLAALPILAITLLVARSNVGILPCLLLVALALGSAVVTTRWIVPYMAEDNRRRALARRTVLATIGSWAVLAALILWQPVFIPTAIGLGVVTIGFGLCGLGLSLLLRSPVAGLIYLGICLGFAIFTGGHSVVPTTSERSREIGSRQSAERYSPSSAFYSWVMSRGDLDLYRNANRPYPIIIASAEGGGIYAAAHSYLSLSAMASYCPSFTPHLYATVGVSGGAIGNLLFAAQDEQKVQNSKLSPCVAVPPDVDHTPLKRDLLSPALANLLILQPLDFLVPYFRIAPDGGEILARTLEDGSGGNGLVARPLVETWTPTLGPPLLVSVSTDVNSGNRFVLSPIFGLGADTAESFTDLTANRAAVTSARFPWLTSSARIEVGPQDFRVLADGGYFENSGADTVIEMIEQIRANAALSARSCDGSDFPDDQFSCERPLVVERSFGEVTWKRNTVHVFIALMAMHSANELPGLSYRVEGNPFQIYLLDPVSTMLATRKTRGQLALSRARRAISGYDDPDNVQGVGVDGGYFEDRTLPDDLELPLGWRLGVAKIEAMSELAAPMALCSHLPGKAGDWRKSVPPEHICAIENPQEEEADLTALPDTFTDNENPAIDDDPSQERKEILEAFKRDNACNMATMADLFNPLRSCDAVSIPGWE